MFRAFFLACFITSILGAFYLVAFKMLPIQSAKLGDVLDEDFESAIEEVNADLLDNFTYVSDVSFQILDKSTKSNLNPFNSKRTYYYYFFVLIDDVHYELQVPLSLYQNHKIDEVITLQEGVDKDYLLTMDGKDIVKIIEK